MADLIDINRHRKTPPARDLAREAVAHAVVGCIFAAAQLAAIVALALIRGRRG